MKIAFGDDSKQRGLRAGMGQLLALGAVIFPEDKLRPYADAIMSLRNEHGIPAEVEMKWSMPGAGNYFRERGEAGLQDTIRKRMLEIALAHDVVGCVVIADTGRTWAQGSALEQQVLKYLYERVTGALRGDRGVLVFDKPGGGHQEEDSWISGTLELTNYGTPYVKPDGIVLPVLTAPSHHHPHIQLADLLTGCVTAAVAGNRYGMDLVGSFLPLLHRNAFDTSGGTGLKLWPDALINLYFHVLGEDTFAKVAMNAGFPLPDPSSPYSEDNGLVAV